MMICKRILSLCICILVFCCSGCPCYAVNEEKREYKESYVLMEASTGTVVRERNGRDRVNMGSLNKLMTVLLAAEAIDRGELTMETKLVCSEHANSMQGAQIWLMPGEKMKLEDLLKAVIIGNANDAACVIAEKIGGSEEKFTALMNNRAKEIGMNDTLFINCNGYYDDDKQYTSAFDASLLLCELSLHEELTPIFTMRIGELKNGDVQLVTTNTMAHRYKGSVGFKCGTGPASGYFAAEGASRDGVTFVAAVMDYRDEDTALSVSKELLDLAFSGYTVISPLIPPETISETVVRKGIDHMILLSAEPLGNVLVPKGSEGMIDIRVFVPSAVYAPVSKGDRIGEIQIWLGNRMIKRSRISAAENVDKKDLKSVLMNMLKNTIGF